MKPDLRFVFDTSVVLSAVLLRDSKPRAAIDHAAGKGKLLISAATIQEIYDVVRRPGFDRYVSEEERLEFLSALVDAAVLIDVTEVVAECRDASDDKFLALAYSGQAACIVTGDSDRLCLHPWRGIPILTASQFLAADW
jgi:uncharacterized protein